MCNYVFFTGADPIIPLSEEFFARFVEALKDATDSLSEKIDCDRIADLVTQKLKGDSEQSEIETFEISDCFKETDDEKLYCEPCFRQTSSLSFPSHLKPGIKGNHGIFNKPNDPKYKTNKERKKCLLDHTRSEVHCWCVNQEKNAMTQHDAEAEVNRRCAEILVTNAYGCLKDLDGSKKFCRLNDMLEMLIPSEYPTKNDGRQMFFSLREIVFEKLTQKIREKFKSTKSACFTLDKVTVRRTPFTVIMTYFFANGKIHVLLNSIHKMKYEEYDGKGSAKMVGKVLMNSLGLTKQEVGEKFRHGTYDGVYASADERVAGGGCLSLMHHFANWCELPEQNFSGNWDVGHKLQLVYESTLKKNKHVSSFNTTMEKMMQKCQGKDGLLFQKVAVELGAAILTDKSEQTTRWVRSLLRIILAYFRNLPVMHAMLLREIEKARLSGNLTEQKKKQKQLDTFCNAIHIAFGIGLAQILDSYAQVSLNAQLLWNFPGSLCIAMKRLASELSDLSQSFKWKESELVIAGIGTPATHLANLEKGVYKTSLSERVKTSAAQRLNLSQMEDYENNLVEKGISGSIADEEEVQFLTSDDIVEVEFPLLGLTEDEKSKVSSSLASVCRDLHQSLSERFQIPPLFDLSVKMFHETNWFEGADGEGKAKQFMSELLPELKNPSLVRHVLEQKEAVTKTYLVFLHFKQRHDKRVEEVYQHFHNQNNSDENAPFFQLFEFINIKSYSEAYCESVGSLMNICVDKDRNLAPANFSKEIFIAFNSPPLHIANKNLISSVATEWTKDEKRFKRKLDNTSQSSMLQFAVSAAIGNARKKAEENAHLPANFFL